MSLRTKILQNLDRQRQIEGESDDINILVKILEFCNCESEWQALTDVKHHRYGIESYKVHLFYYPSQLLRSLIKLNEVK